jgi:NAD(P)-dependent dehydrogenase (short-subunit alcohol dehydrogenase family)/MFS family permease
MTEDSPGPMAGTATLVTGGTGGIGRATAVGLAALGARVGITGRDAARTQAAAAAIARESGNPCVDAFAADMSCQAEVRRLAAAVLDAYPRLDVLVNNVGGFWASRHVTADGLERTFAVNHLAGFLLTSLLLDLLKASAPARIVTVSSNSQATGKLDFTDLQGERHYSGQQAYSQSKLANVMFTYELARRLDGTGVTATVLHPGVVRTAFAAEDPSLLAKVMITVSRPFLKTPAQGAATSIYLASASEVEGVTGQYFANRRPKTSNKASYDTTAAARLWDTSARLICSGQETQGVSSAAARPGDARREVKDRNAAEAALEPEPPKAAHRIGWGFISLYALAYMSTTLLFLAPLLVTLALKVDSLVGIGRAPGSLALVAGTGALLAMVANPFFGRLSDRTASPLGMRRPWMITGLVGGSLGILIVALAPSIPVVLAGWCVAQLFFNALLAAMVAVMPDQVPSVQRGLVSGVLGVCMPVGSVCGTFVVKLFTGHLIAMFLGPCAVGGFFILLFAVSLNDRRLAKAEKPAWSLREFASTFYVNPRKNPDFAWAFASRFMFVLAYAFLVTYQAYYLLDKIGTAKADVPQQIFLGTLAQSAVIVAASLIGGKVSDRTGRRKIFVFTASIVYGLALFMIAVASDFNGFLVGMAISGLGFGVYLAVDLALVVDVLPGKRSTAKDLGVFNIAGALPFSIAPAIAPAILAVGGGSYGVLYTVAGLCAITGAVAILPVRRVR